MRYTEKRNGKNVIPLRNAVCGVDLPKWSIDKYSDIQSFLSGDAVDRLAEIEDKIEQGKMIELPCKVGDTIWVVDESWGYREDGTWGSTSEMQKGKVYSFTYYGNCLHVEDDFTSNCYLWGEDAFLTREEAEKRLLELQGKTKL